MKIYDGKCVLFSCLLLREDNRKAILKQYSKGRKYKIRLDGALGEQTITRGAMPVPLSALMESSEKRNTSYNTKVL